MSMRPLWWYDDWGLVPLRSFICTYHLTPLRSRDKLLEWLKLAVENGTNKERWWGKSTYYKVECIPRTTIGHIGQRLSCDPFSSMTISEQRAVLFCLQERQYIPISEMITTTVFDWICSCFISLYQSRPGLTTTVPFFYFMLETGLSSDSAIHEVAHLNSVLNLLSVYFVLHVRPFSMHLE